VTRSVGETTDESGTLAAGRPGVGLPARPPFVGRGSELDHLTSLLAAAADGTPQLAVVEGPAGIGKTRLAEELAVRARSRGGEVAIGRCWPDGEAPPYWPWRAILTELGAPQALLADDERSGPPGRFARFLAVLQHLRAAPASRPVLIVVDDAHLADPASLLLGRFLTRERGLPLLLLLTRRDRSRGAHSEVSELLADLGRDAVSVVLGGLSEGAVGAYLAAVGLPPSDATLVQAVAAVTKGNPLHLRSVALQSALGASGVGGGLERAIERLLDRLALPERRLMALAALLGPEVSVHDVASLAEVEPARAAESLGRAVELGLAQECGTDRFRFVHELVRRSAAASLGVADRIEGHARAGRLLTGHEPDRLARRAHHALAAAARSRDDAEQAVTVAREAARALRAVDGFEPAAALLARAVDVHAAAGLAGPAAGLIVEQAESVLACGRLVESRRLFTQAARTAEKEDDPVVLARAALGLGGVWVSEHRLAHDAERMLSLQRRALAALPAGERVLRARLAVRLAAEESYRGGPVGAVLDGVTAVRRTGDAYALAEALSLAHHALMSPEHTWRRPAIAKQLIAAAAAAQDGLLSLIGITWQVGDLFLLGDRSAPAALEELGVRADALRCRSVLFIARAQEVMLAIRGAAFEEAEARAAACFELGREVGDADALAYHGAHLCAIRVYQGREAEIAELAGSLAASPTLIAERERRTFAGAAALFALRAGRPEAARSLLERLAREGIASIPPSSGWLPALLVVVELAHALDDPAVAQAAYDALLPYSDLPVMASLAVVCFGSVHRVLGLAAMTCGKLELAIEHLAAAVAANEQLGHRPAAFQAQAELGLARLRRAGGADDPRGRAFLEDAIAAAEAAGMGGLAARWREQGGVAAHRAERGEPSCARMSPAPGGRWRVALAAQVATVPDRVGMRYLARLLATPDHGISALALVVDGATVPAQGPAEAVMDRRALAALRERIQEIRRRPTLSSTDQEELAALARELARATGLGGRIRAFADAPERARTAVRKAIKRAIGEISAANAAVGEHLAARIETGAVCCYYGKSD
jgi:hypothetical protein